MTTEQSSRWLPQSHRYRMVLYSLTVVAIISTIYVGRELHSEITTPSPPLSRTLQTSSSTDRRLGPPRTRAPRTGKPRRTRSPRSERPTGAPRSPKPSPYPRTGKPRGTRAPRSERPTGAPRVQTERPTPRPPPTRPPKGPPPTRAPITAKPVSERPTRAPVTERPTIGKKEPRTPRPVVEKSYTEAAQMRIYVESYDVELIWVLGYPFTGTTITLKIVEHGTNKSMATNYGDKMSDYYGNDLLFADNSVPIHSGLYPDGPFFHNPDMAHDSKVLLVKTYCGGYCLHEMGVNCTLEHYIDELDDFRKFAASCRMGRSYHKPEEEKPSKSDLRRQLGQESEVPVYRRLGHEIQRKSFLFKVGEGTGAYKGDQVSKAILTVRNPFAIVASRFRDYAKHEELYAKKFNAKGVKEFCTEVDLRHEFLPEFQEIKQRYLDVVNHLPCWTEYYRVAKWYNAAIRLLTNLDHMIVWFEDYRLRPDEQVGDMMHFVGLEFLPNRGIVFDQTAPRYLWFTEDDLTYLAMFFQRTMHPDNVMPLFDRYFHDQWMANPFSHK